MKQVGKIYLLDENSELPGYSPYFNDKTVIWLSIIANPENHWPGDERMAAYINKKNKALLDCGILTEEVLTLLNDSDESVEIVAEFESLESAEKAFRMAAKSVVDIYLYHNGELYDKFD